MIRNKHSILIRMCLTSKQLHKPSKLTWNLSKIKSEIASEGTSWHWQISMEDDTQLLSVDCLWWLSVFMLLGLTDRSQACVIMPMLLPQLLMQIGLWCLCSSFSVLGMEWNTTQTRNHAHVFPIGVSRDSQYTHTGCQALSQSPAQKLPKIFPPKYTYKSIHAKIL